jgi:hypothetical protein
VYPVNTNGALDNVLWQWVPEGPMSLRPSWFSFFLKNNQEWWFPQ